jgi:hypothetical protein
VPISGSQNFSFFTASAIPYTIHPNDPLTISYDPQTLTPDIAQLHLKFHLGWKDFDTTISLLGEGRIPKATVKFIPSLSANSATAGTDIHLFVKPDKIISGRLLDSITFELTYVGDLLDYRKMISTSIANATITTGQITRNGNFETLPVTIKGSNLSLDPSKSIADITFRAMLTTVNTTQLTMSNLKLNGGSADYNNCILSADSDNTNFALDFQCGYITLQGFMNGTFPVRIVSLRPNPAGDEVEIMISYGETGGLRVRPTIIAVFDVMGKEVYSSAANVVTGMNSIHIDTKSFSGGVYEVRVGNSMQSFVKIK